MIQPIDVFVALTAFVGILALGAVVVDLLLTTPRHRDAKRRNRYVVSDDRPWWER